MKLRIYLLRILQNTLQEDSWFDEMEHPEDYEWPEQQTQTIV